MKRKSVWNTLEKLLETSPSVGLRRGSRIVIFSDLHIGDRGDRDDFLHNAELFLDVLEGYYLGREYTLVLNGDIEELKKFSLRAVLRRWGDAYRLFGRFAADGRLHKIVGNHDQDLLLRETTGGHRYPFPCTEGLRLRFGEHSILVYHGHQVSTFFRNYNHVSGWLNRYVLYPLGIMNRPVAHDKAKKYKVEKKVYDFSSGKKIVSIIGHTHRPLFESLSKIDSIRYRIESICREYPAAGKREQAVMEDLVRHYKREIEAIYKNGKNGFRSSLYSTKVLVPCLFNSGCAVGKRGITSIEIEGGEIRLVHWFDGAKSRKHFTGEGSPPERLGDSDHFRTVLKKEFLDYIFARITLLA